MMYSSILAVADKIYDAVIDVFGIRETTDIIKDAFLLSADHFA